MRKVMILGAMALVLGVLTVAATAHGQGPVTKSVGKDAAPMIPAVDMFPGSVYDNEWQIPGATGKVNMIQPNGNVDVILGISADGLAPNALYRAYFDTNGIGPGNVSTAGPWMLMGTFETDDEGHGEFNYTAPAGTLGAGSYNWSVFINRTLPLNATVLISYNVEFNIE